MFTLDPNYMYLLTTITNLRRELEEDRFARRTAGAPVRPLRSPQRQPRVSAARSPDLVAPSR